MNEKHESRFSSLYLDSASTFPIKLASLSQINVACKRLLQLKHSELPFDIM